MKALGFGFVYLALAIAIGAFGTHALRDQLSANRLTVFQTGQTYQVVFALALISLGSLRLVQPTLNSRTPFGLVLAGSVVFSGSLYCLALSGVRIWGAITPIGGVLAILGLLHAGVGLIRTNEGQITKRAPDGEPTEAIVHDV